MCVLPVFVCAALMNAGVFNMSIIDDASLNMSDMSFASSVEEQSDSEQPATPSREWVIIDASSDWKFDVLEDFELGSFFYLCKFLL